MTKVVIYARVSSDEQERDGFSIPAQLDLLKNYAKKNNFEIVKVLKLLKKLVVLNSMK